MMRSRSGSMISPLSTIARASMPLVVRQSCIGDDHVLRHVDQAAGQVARVGGLERGVGQALARAVGRDEVLEHREALAEVRADRRLDDLARRLGHQAAHAGQLADLLLAAAGARVGHDVDRVEAALACRGAPSRLNIASAIFSVTSDHTAMTLFRRSPLVIAPSRYCCSTLITSLRAALHQGRLVLRDDQVLDADRHAGARGIGEAHLLQPVQHLDRRLQAPS